MEKEDDVEILFAEGPKLPQACALSSAVSQLFSASDVRTCKKLFEALDIDEGSRAYALKEHKGGYSWKRIKAEDDPPPVVEDQIHVFQFNKATDGGSHGRRGLTISLNNDPHDYLRSTAPSQEIYSQVEESQLVEDHAIPNEFYRDPLPSSSSIHEVQPSPLPKSVHAGSDEELDARIPSNKKWSRDEILALIVAKQEDMAKMRTGSNRGKTKTNQERWKWVSARCAEQRVFRSPKQCEVKWHHDLPGFKKVRDFECNKLSGISSYWDLSPVERLTRGLPRCYNKEVYDVILKHHGSSFLHESKEIYSQVEESQLLENHAIPNEFHSDPLPSSSSIHEVQPSPLPKSVHAGSDEELDAQIPSNKKWSLDEIFALIVAKQEDIEKMRTGGNRGKSKTNQERWKWVSARCAEEGVFRSPRQCEVKWHHELPGFKKVRDFEWNKPRGISSYWDLSPVERLTRGLPRCYKKEVYDVILKHHGSSASIDPGTLPIDSADFVPQVDTQEDPVEDIVGADTSGVEGGTSSAPSAYTSGTSSTGKHKKQKTRFSDSFTDTTKVLADLMDRGSKDRTERFSMAEDARDRRLNVLVDSKACSTEVLATALSNIGQAIQSLSNAITDDWNNIGSSKVGAYCHEFSEQAR